MTYFNFCELCRGTGMVTCYSPWVVVGLTKGFAEVDACGRKQSTWVKRDDSYVVNWNGEVAIPCKCRLGDNWVTVYTRSGKPKQWNGRDKQDRVFDKWWHVPKLPPNAGRSEEEEVLHIQESVDRWNEERGNESPKSRRALRPDEKRDPADKELNRALQEIG